MKRSLLTALLCGAGLLAADTVLPLDGWSRADRAELSRENGVLRLTVTGKTPRLYYTGEALPAACADTLELACSARGLPANAEGNIYFRAASQKLDESRRIRNFRFIGDGKRHLVFIPLPDSWKKNGEISEIRLDLPYQAPSGVFELHGARLLATGKTDRWNGANSFTGWDAVRNGSVQFDGKYLRITAESDAPRLVNTLFKIAAADYDRFAFRYRITGAAKPLSGSLFFHGPEERDFTEARRVSLYNFRTDGKWHTNTVKLPPSWLTGKWITALRFDPGLAAGAVMEIEFFRLYREPESALPHQAAWPAVKAVLPEKKKVALPDPYWQAKLVCAPGDDGRTPKSFAVRRCFSVPGDLAFAQLQITADDRYTLWINGKKIDDRMRNHFWGEPICYDVTEHLLPGRTNVIAVVYRNISGPGGLLFELGLLTKDGKKHFIGSDAGAKCAPVPETAAWREAKFDDASWQKPAKVLPPPPWPPWARIIAYLPLEKPLPVKLLSSDIPPEGEAGKTLDVKLTWSGSPVPPRRARVRLLSTPYKIMLSEQTVTAAGPGKTLTLPVKLPSWYAPTKMAVEIEIPGEKKIGGEFLYNARFVKEKNPPVTVRKTAAGPELAIDGKPVFMLCGNVHISEHQENSRLHEVPVNFRTCYIRPNSDRNSWIRSVNGDYDFAIVDRFVESKLVIDPDVKLIFYVDMSMPRFLADKFRNEITAYSDGVLVHDSVLCASMASAKFRDTAKKALAALIRHCEKAPYAAKVGGYLICGGETLEWQFWGGRGAFSGKRLPDYSPAFQKAFREKHGCELPDAKTRLATGENMLLDPEKDEKLIAANRFYSETVAGTIIELAATAKKTMTVPKLVGIYYGYHFEYATIPWRAQISGHNAVRKILDSGVVDFMLSPPSYALRNLGLPGADMKPYTSIRQAGVLPMIDDDTRTHLIPAAGCYQTVTPEQTRAVIRRNLGGYLCRAEGAWFLPLVGGREFDSDEIISDLRKFRSASEFQMRKGDALNAEVAVVVDEDIYNHLPFLRHVVACGTRQGYRADGTVWTSRAYSVPLTGELITAQLGRLLCSGVPFDCLLSSDVEKNIGKYKVWLFLDTFRYDRKFLEAVKKLRSGPAILAWFYAPGWISGSSCGTENMEKLTGFKFRRLDGPGSLQVELSLPGERHLLCGYPETASPRFTVESPDAQTYGCYHDTGENAVSVRREGRSESWFFGGNHVPAEMWNRFFRRCGIHVYSDTADPLYANRYFVSIHTAAPGRKTIRLPHKSTVTDLFTGEIVAKNASEFSFDANLHESRVFFLGTPDMLKTSNPRK
ncbi:MAG: hypothetical protein IJU70_05175 [Lentisphaeria bacterium]|nr:hypothetical protein [Lentisphaeria bacterium]